jgi:predicted ATP-dependent serine protease
MNAIARLARRIARWTCENCGAINPNITGTCIRCG